MTLTRHIGVLLLVCILPMLSSCREIPTSVKVGNGPSFSFHGSGRLASFRIYGPLKIEYGSIPVGYTQAIPNSGTASALPPGQVYYFFAETTNAPPAEGFFYLDGTTPIQIKVPGLCQSGFVGDVKALKCGTSEPYTEPSNLEQFARENRVQ